MRVENIEPKGQKVDLDELGRIARNSVFEPFEGTLQLEKIRDAVTYLDKKVTDLKGFFGRYNKAISPWKKAIVAGGKQMGASLDRLLDSDEKNDKPNHSNSEFREQFQQTYQNLGEKGKILAKNFIRRAFENLLNEEGERWILLRATSILKPRKIDAIEAVRNLSAEERNRLKKVLYPYDSPLLNQYMKTLDVSFNLGLGTIVATNIPMTGVVVGLINMAKTIVKIGHRLNIMCGIYGHQIVSSTALLRLSAMIIESMTDWENNPEHVPLDPLVLDALFLKSVHDDKDLEALVNALLKKDAYIAIPGVGMVSLGKIHFDDFKLDITIEHLVSDYFNLKRLEQRWDKITLHEQITLMRQIYQAFKKAKYFVSMRKSLEQQHPEALQQAWTGKLKKMISKDIIFLDFSEKLDRYALEIFEKVEFLSDEERKQFIDVHVARILEAQQVN